MNHLSDFLTAIHRSNEWRATAALRHYQLEILGGLGFSVPSPFDGESYSIEASFLIASDQIAYSFCNANFYLLVGPQYAGYPLDRLVDTVKKRMYTIITDEDEPALTEAGGLSDFENLMGMIDSLQRQSALSDSRRADSTITPQNGPDIYPDEQIHALFGDGNFAHLVWNGWPAIAELPNFNLDLDPVCFVSRCDPLGDPRMLFPWLEGTQLCNWDDRSDLHRGRRLDQAVLLGSSFLPAALAGDVLELCKRLADTVLMDQGKQFRARGKPVVWMSLRRRARDCINNVEFLADLIERIGHYEDVSLIMDGFAYPDCPLPDFFHDYRKHVDNDFERLLKLCPALVEIVDDGRLCFLNGCSIFDAIALGSYADFYVSHGGTQQHKISWFHAVPGVIHLPNPSPSVEAWYAAQSEIALPPQCIPASAIDVEISDMSNAEEQSYRILIEEGVEFTMQAFIDSLE